MIEQSIMSVDASSPAEECRSPELTVMESKVLYLLWQGYKPRRVAEELGIGIAAVRSHEHNLHKKFGVCSNEALIEKAVALGYVSEDKLIIKVMEKYINNC